MSSVKVKERKLSRESNVSFDPSGNTIYLDFLIEGTEGGFDDFEARAALAAASPPTYAGLFRQSYHVKPLGNGYWEGRADYSPLVPKQPGEFVRQFDTTGGTAHATCSKETVRKSSWTVGVTAPDYKGAIGVNGDSVEGCDITVPVMAYQETHWLPNSKITQNYVEILYTATGCVNLLTFRYFPTKTVLFLGAVGSQRGGGNEPWEVTFKFGVSPTKTVQVGNSDNTITKEGWNYLWTRYADKLSENQLVKQPVASYVERVYDTYSFDNLGIGS